MIDRGTIISKLTQCEFELRTLSVMIQNCRESEQKKLEVQRIEKVARFNTLKELYDSISEYEYPELNIPYISGK